MSRSDEATPRGPPPATTLFCPAIGGAVAGETAGLDSEEVAHARALRLSVGDAVLVTDGRGARWEAELTEVGRRAVTCRLRVPRPAPGPRPLTLWAPVGNRDRSLWLVEKAVELGVRSVVLTEFARSRSVADAGRSAGFLDRARRRAIAALTQSGGAHLPALEGPHDLEALLETGGDDDATALLMADPAGRPLLATLASGPLHSAVWLAGPEGGLTGEERHAAVSAGFELVGLGARTLRFETAALAGLAVLAAVLDARSAAGDDARAARGDDRTGGVRSADARGCGSMGASQAGPAGPRGGAT